ncbi:3-deoxy-D-manno-octulosonic acid transferase [Rubellimicrobium aerolatum]|uniref:3-deoxy-D-manno-octulosonic acid transferase n=1 Tax=Rubellimicrobium aerolatum TaxID=490979 RepID=A0ABW0SAF4_9RHOB|nr:glycosyltransferase N-terminal domain-containing protein [Rubellimicrobium aerolatum]MBP1805279.1 3-deoxy-D-manno-octulosonic-acid transferase [Rubellimicrobium aerolatum]
MSGSLALGAYLALSALAAGGRPEAEPERPEGPLLWIHTEEAARLPALLALAERLEPEMAVLATIPPGIEMPASSGAAILRPAPPERGGTAKAFLDHWRPDLLLWAGGSLRPGLIARMSGPRLLVDGAPQPRLLASGAGWPGLARGVAPLFDRALVSGDTAAERLARAGLPGERIELAGPLDAPAPVLPCNERERRDLAQTIGARPVWLAGDLPLAELPAVIAAYRLASRSAHRLLLILAPRLSEEAEALGRALAEAGLRVADRAEGEEPEEATQVFLADGPAEMGLWLRLAPLAYLGGTLPGGPGGRAPFEAAALGAALLHGPETAPHGESWERLDTAGAARVVRNGVELGRAVEGLLAPDRVAAMAHAGWDVATQGAEVANRVADLIRETLARARQPGRAAPTPRLAAPAGA